jgi:hypothetical protein
VISSRTLQPEGLASNGFDSGDKMALKKFVYPTAEKIKFKFCSKKRRGSLDKPSCIAYKFPLLVSEQTSLVFEN